MKKLIAILFLAAAVSCNKSNTPDLKDSDQETENFDWLMGNWQRTNEKQGRNTFESWRKINSSEFRGESYTMQAADTVWKENVRLTKSDSTWSYEVMQKGETQATPFKLTAIGEQTFTCENKANEFPKKITYARSGNKMAAVISGGDMEIPFEFKKLED